MENSNVNFDELMSDISEGIKSISSEDGAIKKISEEDAEVILRKSAYSLPTRPSEAGMKPEQIKAAFYRPILDSEKSLIAEVNRVIQESNLLAEKKAMLIKKIVDALKQMDEDVAEGYVKKADGVGGGYVYSTEVGGLMKAATGAEAGTLARRDAQGNISVGIPAESSHAAQKGYVDDNFVPRVGDSAIDGTLAVKSLVVEEGTTLAEVESVMVKEAVIVANSDGVQLAGIYGYVIRVSPERAYGIVYEPASDSLKIGLGVYEVTVEVDPESGEEKQTVNFVFSDDQGQAIATRGQIIHGNIPVWNAEKRTFEDSGKRASDFAPSDSPKLLANALKGSASGEAVALKDVSPLEHNLGVVVKSKNLFDVSKVKTSVGENIVNNGDGTITVKNKGGRPCGSTFGEMCPDLKVGDVFTLSLRVTNAVEDTKQDTFIYLVGLEGSVRSGTSLTTTQDMLNSNVYLYTSTPTNQDSVTEGVVSEIQVELGTTATPYTPYIADTSGVKLKVQGGNLIPYPYAETTKTVNGITFTDNGDGTITANGTATSQAVFYLLQRSNMQIAEDAFLSGCPAGGSYSTCFLEVYNGNEGYNADIGRGILIPKDTIRDVYIVFKAGATVENVTFKPQVEIGTTATDYERYIAPVEYTVNADGTVDGLKSIAPSTTLMSDTEGVLIECQYNQDANAVVAKLEDRLAALEAAVISQ